MRLAHDCVRVDGHAILLVPSILPVFHAPYARYRAAYGGRGSGKSYTFAVMLLAYGMAHACVILCARELQVSIKDSVHAQLASLIDTHAPFSAHYQVTNTEIRGANGTRIIFRGLRHNAAEIKSMADIQLCWVEEAEAVSQASWDVLRPTIRAPNSEIWVTWNPMLDGSPTDKLLRKSPPPSLAIASVNYDANPWFSAALEQERSTDQEMRPESYAHIWLGGYATVTDAQVFKGKFDVQDIPPPNPWQPPRQYLYGADFGFARDPNTLVQLCIVGRDLYITDERVEYRTEIDHLPALYDSLVSKQDLIHADCARPETISYLQRQGYRVIAAPKWQGSVEDGIEFLRGFRIHIAPHCTHTHREFMLYSYKVDRLTGLPTTDIIDDNNHCIDAIRYALTPLIRGDSASNLITYLKDHTHGTNR